MYKFEKVFDMSKVKGSNTSDERFTEIKKAFGINKDRNIMCIPTSLCSYSEGYIGVVPEFIPLMKGVIGGDNWKSKIKEVISAFIDSSNISKKSEVEYNFGFELAQSLKDTSSFGSDVCNIKNYSVKLNNVGVCEDSVLCTSAVYAKGVALDEVVDELFIKTEDFINPKFRADRGSYSNYFNTCLDYARFVVNYLSKKYPNVSFNNFVLVQSNIDFVGIDSNTSHHYESFNDLLPYKDENGILQCGIIVGMNLNN